MACCSCSEEGLINRQINNGISKERKKQVPRLLLLGAGKSGKSTFLKQMRILHSTGFTPVERELEYRPLIAKNIISCVCALHSGVNRLGLNYYALQNGQLAEEMMAYSPGAFLHAGLAEQIGTFWLDPAVQECYSRKREFGYDLPDSTMYFLESVVRMGGEHYVPSDQDIIQSRSPTTSVQEVPFSLRNRQIAIVDVGGQKSERRKWIGLFSGVAAVIYLTAISEYDQVDPETGENLLKHSLALLGTLYASPYFKKSGFIIFMNKADVFEEKIRYAPLQHYFPSYRGPQGDAANAAAHLEECYREVVPVQATLPRRPRSPSESLSAAVSSLRRQSQSDPRDLKMDDDLVEQLTYFHLTTATNTENIKTIFEDVRNMVLIRLIEEVIYA